MVVGVLKTFVGMLILACVFSAPFIGLYLTYEIAWPPVAEALRGRLSNNE